MIELVVLFAFFLGTVLGSFLNVIVLRLHTGEWVTGRSHCPHCGVVLAARDLVPVLSYLALAGRCRACAGAISPQYPLVELATGVLLALVAWIVLHTATAPLAAFGFWSIVHLLFVLIATYDIRHSIIPNAFVYPLIAVAALALFVDPATAAFVVPSVGQLFAGPIVAAPFALMWLVSRGRWMGLGDAKLALALGWLFGIAGGITVVLLAFWIGAALAVSLLASGWLQARLSGHQSTLTMKSTIPFAPYLILGAVVVFATGLDIVALLLGT